MKIVALADLHGWLPSNIPECDVLVIAGDICPYQDHSYWYQKNWLAGNFNDWLKAQPARNIVGVAGNHDIIFEEHLKGSTLPKLEWDYLCDSCVIIDHVKFYGHPWTKEFCEWAFNKKEWDLVEKDEMIPDDTNVLVTHGPPYGILDTTRSVMEMKDGRIQREYLGSKSLKKRVNELKELKLHIFGHIHLGYGMIKPNDTTFINASLVIDNGIPMNRYHEFIL
jgi:Icc-related predicted phosphoesterase